MAEHSTTSLRQRLRQPTPLIGTFSLIRSPEIVELLARANFEAVVLDAEHGPLGPESLNVLVPVCHAAKIYPLIRVRANEPSLIGAALDLGAAGVVVPQIDGAASAQAAVRAARFAPDGQRGVNPYVRAAGFRADAGWYARANAEQAVILMVEGAEGMANLSAILEVPGIDAILIGPYDLSQALGVPGQVEHPDVLSRIEAIVANAARAGVATAVYAPAPALARRWLSLGVRMVALGYDTAMVLDGFQSMRAGIE